MMPPRDDDVVVFGRSGDDQDITVVGRAGVGPAYLSYAERSDVGAHWNPIELYVRTGETSGYINSEGRHIRGLNDFEGMQVGGVELESNPDEIDNLLMRGELDQGPY